MGVANNNQERGWEGRGRGGEWRRWEGEERGGGRRGEWMRCGVDGWVGRGGVGGKSGRGGRAVWAFNPKACR